MKANLLGSMIFLAALAPSVAGAVPQTITFSARIADGGQPVTGSHEFIFRFWNCDGTNPTTCIPDSIVTPSANVIWRETQTLTVSNGVVVAILGADVTTPNVFPVGLFNGADRWLSVSMDGADFGPFIEVHSVPYALRAGLAENALSAADVNCATPGCVSDSDIAAVSGSKVSGMVSTANFANTTSLAENANYAVRANNAANLDSTLYGTWSQGTFSAAGTINTASNPVDWTKLKNVPLKVASPTPYCSTWTASGTILSASIGAVVVSCGTGFFLTGTSCGVGSWPGMTILEARDGVCTIYNGYGAAHTAYAYARCCVFD